MASKVLKDADLGDISLFGKTRKFSFIRVMQNSFQGIPPPGSALWEFSVHYFQYIYLSFKLGRQNKIYSVYIWQNNLRNLD